MQTDNLEMIEIVKNILSEGMVVKLTKMIFTDNLPRKNNKNNKINWKEAVGYDVEFIYKEIKGIVKIVNYDDKTNQLFLKYLEKDVFKITTANFMKCQLGRLLGKYTGEFKIQNGTVFKEDKRDLTIVDREYKKDNKGCNLKYYKYKCNKCGYDEGWISEGHLIAGRGCSCCGYNSKIIVEEINSIVANQETHWMIPYFQGGYNEAKLYTKSSHKKITPICPHCGRIKDKEMIINNIYKTKSIGCPECGDGQSYPNKFMFNLLEQLIVKFEKEYSPHWIKPKKYDYYFELNDKKYIIEMDGGWHKTDNKMSGQTKEKSKFIDDEKDRLAKDNGTEVIRIDCEFSDIELIKNNILNSKLSHIFDLSNIDWQKCEEFALSNLVKITCDYKKNNPNLTTPEICNILKLSTPSVVKYLKKGTKLGWCNYDPKIESFKRSSKSGKMNGKQVEIFKDNISLGIFKSATELQRKSVDLFNIKLLQGSISSVCLNIKKHYKGYVFKYV